MKLSTNTIVVFSLFLACMGAIFQLIELGALPQKVSLFFLFLTLIFFGKPRLPKDTTKFICFYLCFLLIAFSSSLTFFDSIGKAFFAVQGLVYCFTYLLLGSCVVLNQNSVKLFHTAFVTLLVIQILVVVLKYIFYGIDEADWLGTLAHGTGQLSFLFPLLCVPVVILLYRNNFRLLSLLLVSLFAFGIIGEKRAIIFVMPLYVLYCLYVFSERGVFTFLARPRTIITSTGIGLCMVLGVMTIPSLNQEASETFGGSFSAAFIIVYAFEYLTMDYGGSLQAAKEFAALDKNIQLGRLTMWGFVFDWLGSVDWITKLFGLGYGSVTPSVWLHSSDDLLFEVLGVRGGLSGANHALLEVGIIGMLLQTSILFSAFFLVRKWRKTSISRHATQAFQVLELMFLVFFFDYFFYSTVLFNALPIPFILFAGLGVAGTLRLRDQKTHG